MTLKQAQQSGRQGLGGLSQPEESNDPPSYFGRFAPSHRPEMPADAAVLDLQRSRIVDQTLLILWQSGLSAQEADVHEHPENLLEDCHTFPPISDGIAMNGGVKWIGGKVFPGPVGNAVRRRT
jgi:hypothetical protein